MDREKIQVYQAMSERHQIHFPESRAINLAELIRETDVGAHSDKWEVFSKVKIGKNKVIIKKFTPDGQVSVISNIGGQLKESSYDLETGKRVLGEGFLQTEKMAESYRAYTSDISMVSYDEQGNPNSVGSIALAGEYKSLYERVHPPVQVPPVIQTPISTPQEPSQVGTLPPAEAADQALSADNATEINQSDSEVLKENERLKREIELKNEEIVLLNKQRESEGLARSRRNESNSWQTVFETMVANSERANRVTDPMPPAEATPQAPVSSDPASDAIDIPPAYQPSAPVYPSAPEPVQAQQAQASEEDRKDKSLRRKAAVIGAATVSGTKKVAHGTAVVAGAAYRGGKKVVEVGVEAVEKVGTGVIVGGAVVFEGSKNVAHKANVGIRENFINKDLDAQVDLNLAFGNLIPNGGEMYRESGQIVEPAKKGEVVDEDIRVREAVDVTPVLTDLREAPVVTSVEETPEEVRDVPADSQGAPNVLSGEDLAEMLEREGFTMGDVPTTPIWVTQMDAASGLDDLDSHAPVLAEAESGSVAVAAEPIELGSVIPGTESFIPDSDTATNGNGKNGAKNGHETGELFFGTEQLTLDTYGSEIETIWEHAQAEVIPQVKEDEVQIEAIPPSVPETQANTLESKKAPFSRQAFKATQQFFDPKSKDGRLMRNVSREMFGWKKRKEHEEELDTFETSEKFEGSELVTNSTFAQSVETNHVPQIVSEEQSLKSTRDAKGRFLSKSTAPKERTAIDSSSEVRISATREKRKNEDTGILVEIEELNRAVKIIIPKKAKNQKRLITPSYIKSMMLDEDLTREEMESKIKAKIARRFKKLGIEITDDELNEVSVNVPSDLRN